MRYGKMTTKNFQLHIASALLLAVAGALAAYGIVSFWEKQSVPTRSAALTDGPSVVAVAEKDFAPYSYHDEEGNPTGYYVELIGLLAKKMGMRIDVRLMSRDDAVHALRSGEADLMPGLERRLGLPPEFSLSIPLLHESVVAFGKKKIHKVSELHTAKLAVPHSDADAFFLFHEQEGSVTRYHNHGDAFASVAENINDYVITRYSAGRSPAARIGTDHGIRATGPPLADYSSGIGARWESALLIRQINDAATDLIREGALEPLKKKWVQAYFEEKDIKSFFRADIMLLLGIGVALTLPAFAFYAWRTPRIMQPAETHRESLLRVLEYQRLFAQSTRGLYESIHEYNITENCASDESTRRYLTSLGMSEDASYDEALKKLAVQHARPQFAKKILNTFSRENVLKSFAEGVKSLRCEFMYSNDERHWYWVRWVASIFQWEIDNSVRMFIYLQNIDAEKSNEIQLMEMAQRDSGTGLYNKKATTDIIEDILSRGTPQRKHAFLILDIDHLKEINDTLGHAFGDVVIMNFVNTFRRRFRARDIMGRIGGDEFVIFIRDAINKDWVLMQVQALVKRLNMTVEHDGKSSVVSTSIGLAMYPESGEDFNTLYKNADTALYQAKQRGRNCFVAHDGAPTIAGKAIIPSERRIENPSPRSKAS